jgi:hypothetical protein
MANAAVQSSMIPLRFIILPARAPVVFAFTCRARDSSPVRLSTATSEGYNVSVILAGHIEP